ncbi:DUF3093 domain-containing protein [Naasia sp. SYSU D00057]|uniref:DUF3093 domain-containing protein n=1 Tax=Naasia sp. SYSU D00057 TaxID=2817380 RepID=UPI0027DC23C6|nr:DUF3093 domain-containing protein [Naasia sp. SYSU D00057]
MTYRERLWPAPWMYLATALLIPGALLVFVPVSLTAGIICAVILFGGAVLGLLLWSPVLEVRDGVFRVGSARIPLEHVGPAEGFRGPDATAARGVDLDARAWLCLRGWVDPVVRVPITDPRDPAPYWLVSTRRPEELVAALGAGR